MTLPIICLAARSHVPSRSAPPPLGHEPPHRSPLSATVSTRSQCCHPAATRCRRARSDRHPSPRRNRIPPHPHHPPRHPPAAHHRRSRRGTSRNKRRNLLGRIFRQRRSRRSPHLRLHRRRRHLERRLHFPQGRHPSRAQHRSRSLGELSLGAHRRLRRRMPHPARHLRFHPRRVRPAGPAAGPRRRRHSHRSTASTFLPTRRSNRISSTASTVRTSCSSSLPISSSSIYGCRVGSRVFFSTMVEPSEVNRDRQVRVYGSEQP